MTSNGRVKRSPPKPPPPSTSGTRAPTPIEGWYLECLRVLTAHHGRPPKITELAAYCDRAVYPVYQAMLRLERNGHVKRNADRRFEVTP